MDKMLVFGAFVLILLTGVIYLTLFSKNNVKLINSEMFESIIADEDVFVLQAHIPYMGEIEGTDLVMEEWENPELYLDKLPENKKEPIAVYCRSGRMSSLTSQKLLEMGYKNIYELDGGMNAWKESGRTIINEK